jgi:hypothetical protein
MKKVLRSFKSLAFPFIRSELPRIQRARPRSRFARARFAPTACPQAGASAAEPPAEAKPALAPASRARAARQGAVSSRDPGTPPSGGSLRRQPRQGAVSSPRPCPNQPLLGPMWRKWLKVAAWTLAFLLSAGGNQISHSETFANSLSLNDPPKTDRPNIDRSLKSAMEVPRHQHLATKISP